MFYTRVEGGIKCISKAAIVEVLNIDDLMLHGEECWELPELETSERDILQQLEIGFDDVIQHQTEEIADNPEM